MANLKLQNGSQWWYGRYMLNGKEQYIQLGIKVAGNRPARLKDTGDQEFERSRLLAQIKMDEFLENLKIRKSKEKLAKEIYKIQTGGEELPEYALEDLFKLWCEMKTRSEGRTNSVRPQIKRFIKYMKKKYPRVQYSYQVTASHAKAFMDSEANRGVAPSTYNSIPVQCIKDLCKY